MRMAEKNCIIRHKWLMQKAEFKDTLEGILKAARAKHLLIKPTTVLLLYPSSYVNALI